MKRKQFFFRAAGIAVAAAALITIGVWQMAPKTSAQDNAVMASASAVADTFGEDELVYTGMEVQDIELVKMGLEPRHVFHSEQTQRDYLFSEDGALKKIDGCRTSEELENADKLPALEESVLEETMRAFAIDCLGPNRIGEIVCTRKGGYGAFYDYLFKEIYNGDQTGTWVTIECLQDGSLVRSFIDQGSCFEKLADGTIQELYPVEITPEQACEIAVAAVEEELRDEPKAHIIETEPVWSVEAYKDKRYYTVELETTCPYHDDCIVYYKLKVDATDGTILEIYHSV